MNERSHSNHSEEHHSRDRAVEHHKEPEPVTETRSFSPASFLPLPASDIVVKKFSPITPIMIRPEAVLKEPPTVTPFQGVGIEVVRKEEEMELEPIPEKPAEIREVLSTITATMSAPPSLITAASADALTIAKEPSPVPAKKNTLLARLAELRKEFEKPLGDPYKFAELASDPSLDIAPIKQTFLSSSVGVYLGSKIGKVLHGEHWQKDPKWIKDDITGLLALDKKRLEKEHAELLAKIEGKSADISEAADTEMKDASLSIKPAKFKVVPKVYYWEKRDQANEIKGICKKAKQAEKERKQLEHDTAARNRALAEIKVKMLYSELKTKLLDLKLSGISRSSA